MNPPRRSPPSGSVDTADDDRTLMEMQRDATEPILLDEDLFDDRPLIDDDPEPGRKPFGERFAEWRRHYLPLPDEVVGDYLGEDEYVVHTDHPSFRAFLVQNIALVLIISIVGPVFVYLASGGITWTTLLLFLAFDVVLLYMAVKRLQDRYVSYVITNLRLIRVAGVFGRKINSIPWTRMTGLGYFQSPLGRILGYATVFIESANEESGLRSLTNINDPATFHQRILDLVSSKTGQSAGGKPPPPTKGVRKNIFQRRRERREAGGGPTKAAAPWPKADDPDGDDDKQGPTDSAKAYEAATPEDEKPAGTKQALRPKGAGQRLGTGGSAGDGGRRRGQSPPSARRRGPAPPGPTDPFGDPPPPAPRGAAKPDQPPGERRPGTLGTSGRPRVPDATPPGQRLPGSGRRPAGDDRPSLIPDYGRSRTEKVKQAPPKGGEAGGTDAGVADPAAEGGETPSAFPQAPRESAPLTPPRGSARIRPGEPRTPPGGTGAATDRGPAPTPPPPRPPQRRGPLRRSPTPPAGTPAVHPGEPRDTRPPTDAGASTGASASTIDDLAEQSSWPDPTGPARPDLPPPDAADAEAGQDTIPEARGPAPAPPADTHADPGAMADAADAEAEPGTAPEAHGPAPAPPAEAHADPGAVADEPGTRTDPDTPDAEPERATAPEASSHAPAPPADTDADAAAQDTVADDEPGAGADAVADAAAAEAGAADKGTQVEDERGAGARAGTADVDEPTGERGNDRPEVPEFAPPKPQTPPSSRRMTPPGGSSAVRPGEPRPPQAGGDGGGDGGGEPVISPSLRRHTPPGGTAAVRPGEPRRRPEPEPGPEARRPETGTRRPEAEPRHPEAEADDRRPETRRAEARRPETGQAGRPGQATGESRGEAEGDRGAARRQPWLFGRPRPGSGEAGSRGRRRFPWFRRELVDQDDGGGDGDAHDALETLRPLGSARRRAQVFRRPRFRSLRTRRSAFPPGRELPPAADDAGTGHTTDEDPDTA